MTSKKDRSEKKKAKQEFLEERRDEMQDMQPVGDEDQVEAFVRVLSDHTAPTLTFKEMIADILRRAKDGDEIDDRLLYLIRDYRNYKRVVLALVVVAFLMLFGSMALFKSGMIMEEQQNFIIILANFVALACLIVYFARVSPAKRDISDWQDAQNAAAQALFDAHRRGVKPKKSDVTVDLDEFFSTRGRRKRSERIPPTPEYRRIRTVWWALIVVAGLLMVAAMLLARMFSGDITNAIIALVASWVLLFIAMFIERGKLKPMREEYREQQAKRRKKGKGRK